MKSLMMIGSVHTDIVQYVRELPKGNENTEILNSEMRVSGSGYKAARIFQAVGFPYALINDPGTSVYGSFAREQAEKQGIKLLDESEEVGGCTFTMIDPDGKEGIFCMDGSEYHFSIAQLYDLDTAQFGAVTVFSEMLVSEGSGEVIEALDALELPVYAVFSFRSHQVEPEMFEALAAFEPVMIMRDTDACELCGRPADNLDEAAAVIQKATNAALIVLMENGDALYLDSEQSWIAPGKSKADTDAWAAAFIASQMAGVDPKNGMMFAHEFHQDPNADAMKKRLAGMILHR